MKARRPLLEGTPASPGKARGIASVIANPGEVGEMKEGAVLVTQFSTPLLTPALMKACAMVTDKGGMLSHAAIVARELGIPCVTGTERATATITDGMEVIVDGDKGFVYEGD